MVNFERKETYSLQDLIEILRILRAPGGCPWDRAQTHLSDRRNFLEEAYEAAEAFDRDDPALMCEELGDMLMQVLFNIHIEEDAGRFTTDDVTDHICKKLIFRHPHVFGTAAADTSEEVLVNWEALKRQEKGQQTTADAMDAVARSLPALWRAERHLREIHRPLPPRGGGLRRARRGDVLAPARRAHPPLERGQAPHGMKNALSFFVYTPRRGPFAAIQLQTGGYLP